MELFLIEINVLLFKVTGWRTFSSNFLNHILLLCTNTIFWNHSQLKMPFFTLSFQASSVLLMTKRSSFTTSRNGVKIFPFLFRADTALHRKLVSARSASEKEAPIWSNLAFDISLRKLWWSKRLSKAWSPNQRRASVPERVKETDNRGFNSRL